MGGGNTWSRVYEIVRRIPAGRVMSYGMIAHSLEKPIPARAVGWAMRQCPGDVPWHRVVNASGECSTEGLPHLPKGLQKALLQEEGIEFGPDYRIPMDRYRWCPHDEPAP